MNAEAKWQRYSGLPAWCCLSKAVSQVPLCPMNAVSTDPLLFRPHFVVPNLIRSRGQYIYPCIMQTSKFFVTLFLHGALWRPVTNGSWRFAHRLLPLTLVSQQFIY